MKQIITFVLSSCIAFTSYSATLTNTNSYLTTLINEATKGNAEDQFNLAVLYDSGDSSSGVSQNHEEALKWYEKAAEQEYARAENNLGTMYYFGEGLPQNYKEAAKWYLRSADQGNANAQNNLGVIFYYGEGVPQNYIEAAKWYRKAAEQGHATAQYHLSMMYELGLGVLRNANIAYAWLILAKYNGYDIDLNEFNFDINIKKAQLIAKRCLESNYLDCEESSAQEEPVHREEFDILFNYANLNNYIKLQ